MSIPFLLHLLALAAFVASALGIPSRVNLIALGLALWMASLLWMGPLVL